MTARRPVIAIGQFPPPYNGFSLMTQALVDKLRQRRDVLARNIAPPERHGRIRRHLVRLWRVLGACAALTRHAERNGTSVYLGCESGAGLYLTLMLAITARAMGCRILLHHHSFSYIHRHRQLMRLLLLAGGSRLTHIFLCDTMRNAFAATYGATHQDKVLSNAVFVSGDQGEPAASVARDASVTLGHLSNLTREKGLHTFLALFQECRRQGLSVKAVLAGPVAGEQDLREIARVAAKYPEEFAYLGPVRDSAKREFYRRTDVFVFATEYVNEAQPVVLFEAAAHGNLIAANRRGCIERQIPAGSLLVDSPVDFVGAALEWLRPLAEQPARLKGARREVMAEFGHWKAQASLQLVQLFECL